MNLNRYIAPDALEANGPVAPAAVADRPDEPGALISIADLKSMAWRQRFIVLAILAAAVLISLMVTLATTPIFKATATVQVNQEKTNIVAGQDVDPIASISDANRYLKTQEQIIKSRSLAARVADDLGLAKDDSFLTAMGMKPLSETVPPAQRAPARREVAIAVLQRHLDAKLPVDSRVAEISFLSPAPMLAAKIANAYAKAYIDANIQRQFQATDYAREFLRKQIDEARQRLANSENQSIDYASSTRLIDASDAAASSTDEGKQAMGRSLTTASLVRLNEDLSAAKANRIKAEQRWRQISGMPLLDIPEVIDSPVIANLLTQRSTLQAQLAQLGQRYGPDYPETVQLKAKLNAIERQIGQIGSNIRDGIRSAYDVAARQEASLRQALNQGKSETLSEQQRRVQLNVLARDVETNRGTLDDLLKRYNDISAAAGIIANNIALIDPATIPNSPVKPRPLVNIALGLAIGAALALLAAFIRESLDDTVRSPDDVERKLQAPVLGATPVLSGKLANAADALAEPASMLAESYYSVRAAMDFTLPQGRPRSLLVTSSAAGEGKSTSSFALAQDYARVGSRTLLVDGDLRRPSVHRLTGIKNETGLVDVLAGRVALADAVETIEDSGLHVLTLGAIPSNPAQILSTNAFPDFVQSALQSYDLLVIDTAPVMGLADTPLMARSVEGVVLVVEAGRAHRGQAKTSIKRLREAGGVLLGVVLTKFDSRNAGYSYNYYANYYKYGLQE